MFSTWNKRTTKLNQLYANFARHIHAPKCFFFYSDTSLYVYWWNFCNNAYQISIQFNSIVRQQYLLIFNVDEFCKFIAS